LTHFSASVTIRIRMPRKSLVYVLSFLLLPFLGLAFIVFLAGNKARAAWRVDSLGRVVYEVEGDVLGKPENPGKSDQAPGQSKNIDDVDLGKEDAKESASMDETEDTDETDVEDLEESEEDEESGEKVTGQERAAERKTVRTNEYVGRGSKLRIKHEKNNRIQLELENGGDEIPESTPSAELEIEDSVNKNKTKVRSNGRAFSVIRDNIEAKTNFPLSVDLDTNELIVTTPKGSKVVTILPDQAVSNMLAANVLDQAGGKGGFQWLASQQESGQEERESTPSADEATDSADVEELEEEVAPSATASVDEEDIELTATDNGTLAYEIPGIKYKKLFGLFDIKLQRKAVVSAETGELLRLEQDFRDRILSFLSL